MTLYKFLNKEDVHYWLGGSILISSLTYFRKLEGPEWIRDESENVSEFMTGELYVEDRDEGAGKVLADRLEATGAFIVPPGTTNFGIFGLTVVKPRPEVYALCFSREPFESAKHAMCVSAPEGYRYNACIAFPNPSALIRHIHNKGRISGKPLRQLFDEPVGRNVAYVKRKTSLDREDPVHFGPFDKPAQFAQQQEFRYAFNPKVTMGERLNVVFPPRPDLMKRIF